MQSPYRRYVDKSAVNLHGAIGFEKNSKFCKNNRDYKFKLLFNTKWQYESENNGLEAKNTKRKFSFA